MRWEERSADRAASPRSPSSTSVSSSRLARIEVSGVRSSCEASATNWRWRSRAPSVSSREASKPSSMACSVCASSATSSSARGLGQRLRRVARALDVVGGRREPGDRGHRAPAQQDAAEQRQQRAAEHARAEEEADAPDGGLDVGDLARVLDDEREDQPLGVADARRRAGASPRGSRRRAPCAAGGCRSSGAFFGLAQDVPRGLRDPDHGLVGGGVLVEVGPARAWARPASPRSGCGPRGRRPRPPPRC